MCELRHKLEQVVSVSLGEEADDVMMTFDVVGGPRRPTQGFMIGTAPFDKGVVC